MKRFGIIVLSILFLSLSACKKDEKDGTGDDNNTGEQTFSHRLGAGNSAEEFLRNERFGELMVEVQYVDGYEPTQQTLNNVKSFLGRYLHKPDGITIYKTSIDVNKSGSYSLDDIREIEDSKRTQYSGGNRLAAYVFYADKEYSGNTDNSTILGIAYRNTSMVIFEKSIKELSGGITQPSQTKLETTVSNHEWGHVLGLVNNGTPMENYHQDDGHGHHCDNDNCLMYYTVETADVVGNLVGSDIPQLDGNCQNDIQSNGGR